MLRFGFASTVKTSFALPVTILFFYDVILSCLTEDCFMAIPASILIFLDPNFPEPQYNPTCSYKV